MRSIRWFLFGIGLILLQPSTWSAAQDAPRPTVQVIVGPDGGVRVFDPKTGKEIASVVTRVAPNSKPEDAQRILARHQLEQARHALEEVLQNQQKNSKDAPQGPERKGIEIELQLIPNPGPGQPRVIVIDKRFQRVAPPKTLEQKIDLLLSQMAELRQDVNQLKSKLAGNKPGVGTWQVVPTPGTDKKPESPRILTKPTPGPQPDKKADPELRKLVEELRNKLEAESKAKIDKALRERRPEPRPVDRNAELEQRLERILREAEELRREILKSKSPAR